MIAPAQIEVPDDEVVAVLRRMTVAERLAAANRIWVSARAAVENIVRSEHADFTEAQIRQEIARRMLHQTQPPDRCPGLQATCQAILRQRSG